MVKENGLIEESSKGLWAPSFIDMFGRVLMTKPDDCGEWHRYHVEGELDVIGSKLIPDETFDGKTFYYIDLRELLPLSVESLLMLLENARRGMVDEPVDMEEAS